MIYMENLNQEIEELKREISELKKNIVHLSGFFQTNLLTIKKSLDQINESKKQKFTANPTEKHIQNSINRIYPYATDYIGRIVALP